MQAGTVPAGGRNAVMPAVFALTLLVGSGLLFLVQPMCAKMVLPLLGGSPGVWNTCMLFFQAGLLAGYAYAHAGPLWLGTRFHGILHLGLLLVPLLFLPIALGQEPPDPDASPVLWLLEALLISAGFPFVMLASNAPLLQKWFAASGHARARDPYFLYAASNLGSMAALLGYPFLVEPNFSLSRQSALWAAGYVALAILSFACAAYLLLSRRAGLAENDRLQIADRSVNSNLQSAICKLPSRSLRLSWLLLALVPSSLMLSVTTFLTTDIAAIPLFWVVPLALYLLTFILVFSGNPLVPHAVVLRWLPLMVVVLVFIKLSEATEPAGLVLGIHLLGMFWICLACHGELARRRPDADHLTEYYLWLALGGVLGGMFNALLAPSIFTSIVEYPLMLIAACLLLPRPGVPRDRPSVASSLVSRRWSRATIRDVALPVLLGLATVVLVVLGQKLRLQPGPMSVAAMFMAPVVIGYTFMERPVRFGMGLAAILLAGTLYSGVHGRTVYRARSFFGVHQVTEDAGFRKLVHGNTIHGLQSLDPAQQTVPLGYYHPKGPIGQLFKVMKDDRRLKRVALIGLGTGAMAAYAGPGQHWTFFEIDPEVIHIASPEAELFTYLRDARVRGGRIDVRPGDGRLNVAASDELFGMIVVDAFNSDSIPVHLLTREALEVYRSRLAPGGILAMHISNRYLHLERVLANLAQDSSPPMVCMIGDDRMLPEPDKDAGRLPAQWAVLARSADDLKMLLPQRLLWRAAQTGSALHVWTDDFSDLFRVFKWRE
jgi:spermidine synthase